MIAREDTTAIIFMSGHKEFPAAGGTLIQSSTALVSFVGLSPGPSSKRKIEIVGSNARREWKSVANGRESILIK